MGRGGGTLSSLGRGVPRPDLGPGREGGGRGTPSSLGGGTPDTPSVLILDLARGGYPNQSWMRGYPRYPPILILDLAGGYPGYPLLDLGWGTPLQIWDGVPPHPRLDGVPPVQTWDEVPPHQRLDGYPPSRPGMGYLPSRDKMGYPPPVQTWDGVPPSHRCEQTENITFPHPLDAGGNDHFGNWQREICVAIHISCTYQTLS